MNQSINQSIKIPLAPITLKRHDSPLRLWRYIDHLLTYLWSALGDCRDWIRVALWPRFRLQPLSKTGSFKKLSRSTVEWQCVDWRSANVVRSGVAGRGVRTWWWWYAASDDNASDTAIRSTIVWSAGWYDVWWKTG